MNIRRLLLITVFSTLIWFSFLPLSDSSSITAPFIPYYFFLFSLSFRIDGSHLLFCLTLLVLGFLQDSRVVGRIQHEMLKKNPDLNKISNNFTPCRQLSFAWCLLCPCLLFGLGLWVIPDILWLLILSIHNIGTRFGALIFWTSHLGSGFKDDTRLKLDSRGSLESLLNMPLLNAFHGGMNDNYILAV